VLETPAWDLTVFKVHFGLLTLKGYTKGARVLRFEAITHNTGQLGGGRALERFPQIAARLAGMCQRFCTALDCVDIGFIPGGTLDQLPLPAQLGASRVGGTGFERVAAQLIDRADRARARRLPDQFRKRHQVFAVPARQVLGVRTRQDHLRCPALRCPPQPTCSHPANVQLGPES
jgi:hypothetical protein